MGSRFSKISLFVFVDDTVVVFHDDSLARMTGNDGYIKYLTKQDIKALTLKDYVVAIFHNI